MLISFHRRNSLHRIEQSIICLYNHFNFVIEFTFFLFNLDQCLSNIEDISNLKIFLCVYYKSTTNICNPLFWRFSLRVSIVEYETSITCFALNNSNGENSINTWEDTGVENYRRRFLLLPSERF